MSASGAMALVLAIDGFVVFPWTEVDLLVDSSRLFPASQCSMSI